MTITCEQCRKIRFRDPDQLGLNKHDSDWYELDEDQVLPQPHIQVEIFAVVLDDTTNFSENSPENCVDTFPTEVL